MSDINANDPDLKKLCLYSFDLLKSVLFKQPQTIEFPQKFKGKQYPIFVTWLKGENKSLRGCIGTFQAADLETNLHDFTLPFIHSQREDRRKLDCDRDDLPQGTPNDQDFVVNAQTLKNISRKRLCTCASKETREAWQMVKDKIREFDPVMADKMVRNCVYCGFCPELKCCGFVNTEEYKKELEAYRKKDYD